jgi:hypothetical protein
VSANIDAAGFVLPITASYNGPGPSDASANPNYRLRLEITHISIWGGAYPSSSLQTLAWSETTAGHSATSPSIALAADTNYQLASNYRQLVWDPTDFDQPIAGVNYAYTRTFDILGGNGLRFGDGIIVKGLVSLVYDATPQTGPFRWQTTGIGNWATGSNWDTASAPSSNAVTAIFGPEVTAPTTVVTNAAVTAKALQFDSAHSYAIGGAGSVTLAADTGHAGITALQGSHQLLAVVNLSSETDVNISAGSTLALQNTLNIGANHLNKTGTGTLQINNVLNTGSGNVNALGGTISGSGRVSNDLNNTAASVAPGIGLGELIVGGDYTQSAGGTLKVELGGAAAGSYDQLAITGTAALGGLLDVSLINAFAPSAGNTFTILTATAGRSGTFSTLPSQLPPLGSSLAWQISYGANNVMLSVGLAGDYNNDQKVDAADYVVWRNSVGSTNVLVNDPHGGTIGTPQYDTWRDNFGRTAPGSSGFNHVVPEPGGHAMVVVSLPVLIGCGILWDARTKRTLYVS